jgi:hypothetical protein
MSHPRLALSLLFCSAIASSSANAQSIPSAYSFVELGQEWAIFSGKSAMNAGGLGLGPQDATVFGARYGAAFGGMAALDVHGTWFQSTRDVLDVTRPEGDRSIGRSDFAILLVDARLRVNLTGQRGWHGIQPFVAFGGGVAGTGSIDHLIESAQDLPAGEWFDFGPVFTGVLAAGTNIHIATKLSLRIGGEMALWKVGTPLGWRTLVNDPLSENPESEWVPAYSITVGAAWRR